MRLRRCAPGVPGEHGRCGRVGRGSALRLVLACGAWPGAARRAFRAGMVAAAGWAGTRLSGSRASEARPERPVFRGLRGFDSLRALATGPRLTSVVGGPGTFARNDPIRLRSEPLPTLPFDAFAFGRGGVSRPFEGLDSFGAVRTLRRRSSLASRADAKRPRNDRRVKPNEFASPSRAVNRKREAHPFAHQAELRSVRTAPRLSRPSMGRDTLSPPPTVSPAAGWAGARIAGESDRCGRKPPVRQPRRRARPDGERAEAVEATEPAEDRPFRPGFRCT